MTEPNTFYTVVSILEQFCQIRVSLRKWFSGDFLFSRVFVLSTEAYRTLHDRFAGYLFENVVAAVENETVFHVVAKIKDQAIIESLVTDTGGRILQIPDEESTLKDFLKINDDKIGVLDEQIAKLRGEL